MYYLSRHASRIRRREAQNARKNRAEIVKALSIGQITRRDLYKWGILTFGGLALKNGLSPFARSAFAAVPTGTPASPLFGAQKFTQPLPRLRVQAPQPLTRVSTADPASAGDVAFPASSGETLPSRRLSYHTDFTCPDTATSPWVVSVNGGPAHSMNANRVSLLYPKAGDIEHWTYINGGGGWDHPIHLHFEEGITMNRGNETIPATENLVRKDVWRLRPSGAVQF
jgi:FtsP/CotA-like multicopper oxidase with cupredoxin domain